MKVPRLRTLIQTISRSLDRKEQGQDAPELSDSRHDDAWLDAQMRDFFRAEYGKSGPPNDISLHLVQAIRRYHEKQNKRAPGFEGTLYQTFRELGRVPGAIYRFGSRPDTSRLLSGSMVAALLVLAMAPKIVQSLSPTDSASYATYDGSSGEFWSVTRMEKAANARLVADEADDTLLQPALSPGLEVEQPRLFLERRIGEDLDAPTPQQENELHPIERGLGPRNSTAPVDSRNGPVIIQW